MSGARVCVVGAGAVGSYFGGRAALAGADVTLCLRTPRPELTLRVPGAELRPPVTVVTDPDHVPEADWVLLAVKSHQTPGTAAWLAALDRPDGPALVMLQNGVRLERRVAGLWTGPVVPTVVMVAAKTVSPGVVDVHVPGTLTMQDDTYGRRLAAVFGEGANDVSLVSDVVAVGWQKLVLNAAGNSVTGLTCRTSDVIRVPGIADLMRDIMTETVAVARADGVVLADDVVESTLAMLQSAPPGIGTSMYHDRMAGRELEHEALIGSVVSIGAQRGVPTPTCATVLALLRAVSGRPLPG